MRGFYLLIQFFLFGEIVLVISTYLEEFFGLGEMFCCFIAQLCCKDLPCKKKNISKTRNKYHPCPN